MDVGAARAILPMFEDDLARSQERVDTARAVLGIGPIDYGCDQDALRELAQQARHSGDARTRMQLWIRSISPYLIATGKIFVDSGMPVLEIRLPSDVTVDDRLCASIKKAADAIEVRHAPTTVYVNQSKLTADGYLHMLVKPHSLPDWSVKTCAQFIQTEAFSGNLRDCLEYIRCNLPAAPSVDR